MHKNQYLIDICIMEGCTVLEDSCIECGTPEDWEQAMAEPLWSNKSIINRAIELGVRGKPTYIAWERTAREMRDDYEQRIKKLEASRADFAEELKRQTLLAAYRQQRITELEAEIERLRALLVEVRGKPAT